MRYGDRSSCHDLFLKQRDHTSVASKNIAEAYRHKFRIVMLVEGLDDHLADPLARPHDVGGIHSLIGGDHDKAFGSVHGCCISGLPGSEHIILDSLIRAGLHQRHMLMGCRMVYDLRLIMLKDPVHAVGIPHGSDQHYQLKLRISCLKLLLYIIHTVFINIQNKQHGRLMGCDLTAELTADRAASPCHQYTFSFHVF